MGLARVKTRLSDVLVRRLGDGGGAKRVDVEAEIDNLIAWASSAVRCIHTDDDKVDSSGAGPDVLHTFSLPAGSLGTNGDYLNVFYAGGFASVNRDKFVQAQIDGQSYENGGGFDFDGNTGWILFNRIYRLDSTHVRVSHMLMANLLTINSSNTASSQNVGGFAITRNSASITVSNLNSNPIVMRVRSVVSSGVPAAADVFQNLSIIEMRQQ